MPTTTSTSSTKPTYFVTWGPVRGEGKIRKSLKAAQADLARDRRGCANQGGYSDRAVYTCDRSGRRVALVNNDE